MKKSGWLLLPAAFFLFLNFSVSPVKVLFLSRLIYFSFLILLFLLVRRVNLDRLLPPVVFGVSLILFIYGVFQKFVLFPLYLKHVSWENNFYSQALIVRIQSGRIFSLFALPTLYAAICAVLIIFAFHYFLHASQNKTKLAWALLGVLGLFNLVLTQSFGGIFFLALGILLYLLLAGILKLKYLAPVLMVLFFFVFIVIAMRFSEAKEFEPIKLRLSNWMQCVRIIRTAPFWGVGLGNYESEISHYTLSNEAKSIYAHNFFLQFNAETGTLMTFSLLLFLFLSRKKWRLEPQVFREKKVYVTAFLILLFYNAIDIGIYFFSAGIALSIILSQIYRTANPEKKKWSPIFHLVLLAGLSFFMIMETLSDHYAKEADFLASQKDNRSAIANYNKSLAVFPFNYKSLFGCAYADITIGDTAAADRLLDRGLAMFQDSPFGNFLKSETEYARGHFFRAFYYASTAYQKNKMNAQYEAWYRYLKTNLEQMLRQPGTGTN
ncbi:MAG: O-antigen ligase family protein [Candidatus Omnitrophota bacterium]